MQAEIIAPMRCYITNFHCSKPSLITPANQSLNSPNTNGGYLLQATTLSSFKRTIWEST